MNRVFADAMLAETICSNLSIYSNLHEDIRVADWSEGCSEDGSKAAPKTAPERGSLPQFCGPVAGESPPVPM